ncbi:Uncharacterised protein [uncultured archaeon]|nr:Uncharacterised protein [uncultured archaeon]
MKPTANHLPVFNFPKNTVLEKANRMMRGDLM